MEEDTVNVARVVTEDAILVYCISICMMVMCVGLSIFRCAQWCCERCCPGPQHKLFDNGDITISCI